MQRIPNLEAGFFALGRLRYAELFAPSETHLLDAYILQEDAKHFKNLHLQESRLSRRYQQDLKELKELQAQRKKEQEEKEAAAKPKPLAASVNGFEFTIPETTRNSNPSVTPDPNASHTGRSFNGRTAAADLAS